MTGANHEIAVLESAGPSPVLLICEHASNRIPPAFAHVDLPEDVRNSHSAWDPGALDLARALAALWAAPLVRATVSRLLYDLNRPPHAADAITPRGESAPIPGNTDLSPTARNARVAAIHDPWHRALDRAIEAMQPAAIVTVHSFTPAWRGVPRDTRIGIVHDADSRLADATLARASGAGLDWRRNDPYGPEHGVTHTLKVAAEARGLLPLMIEVRNDLLQNNNDIISVAASLESMITPALADCGAPMAAPAGQNR